MLNLEETINLFRDTAKYYEIYALKEDADHIKYIEATEPSVLDSDDAKYILIDYRSRAMSVIYLDYIKDQDVLLVYTEVNPNFKIEA